MFMLVVPSEDGEIGVSGVSRDLQFGVSGGFTPTGC